MSIDKEWSNNEDISIRTRLAVRLIILAIKILKPYRFEHRFETELEDISKMLETPKSAPKESV